MSSRKCRESQRKQNNIRNITEIKACKKPIELKKKKLKMNFQNVLECLPLNITNYTKLCRF